MTEFEKKENELFEKWIKEQQHTSFLKDGVIDGETYFKEKVKVLFILKEANCPNGRDDLKKYLRSPELKGNWWKTWNNIARWTIALLDGGCYPKTISSSYRASVLKRIAFLNLKKEGGGAQADPSKIANAAKTDNKYIKKQIEMYDPDIIICCGQNGESNATILRNYVLKDNVSEWQKLKNSVYYYHFRSKDGKQIPIVSFTHPQMRGGHKKFEEKYDLMVGVRNELLS